jgi:hypothetical protein
MLSEVVKQRGFLVSLFQKKIWKISFPCAGSFVKRLYQKRTYPIFGRPTIRVSHKTKHGAFEWNRWKIPNFPSFVEQCTNYGYLFKLSHGTLKRICHPTDFSGAFPPEREVTSAPHRIDIHNSLSISSFVSIRSRTCVPCFHPLLRDNNESSPLAPPPLLQIQSKTTLTRVSSNNSTRIAQQKGAAPCGKIGVISARTAIVE